LSELSRYDNVISPYENNSFENALDNDDHTYPKDCAAILRLESIRKSFNFKKSFTSENKFNNERKISVKSLNIKDEN